MRGLTNQRLAYNDALVIVEPPIGCKLESQTERDLWEQYTSMRMSKDWNVSDRRDLYWLVRMEADLIDTDETLRQSGLFEVDPRSGALRPSVPLTVRQALMRDLWKGKARLGLTLDANFQQHLIKRSPDAEGLGRGEPTKRSGHLQLLAGDA